MDGRQGPGPRRRPLILAGALCPFVGPTSVQAGPSPAQTRIERRPLVFPRDHGAHPDFAVEWWYATGELRADGGERSAGVAGGRGGTSGSGETSGSRQTFGPGEVFGFQLTFFRVRTGLATSDRGRFAPRHLLFAHAAITDLAARRLLHAGRIARWNGDPQAPLAAADTADTGVHIGEWRFARHGASDASRYQAQLGDRDADFGYTLALAATQPVLLQGDAGFSRKGPLETQASHYYSQPQLAVQGMLALGARRGAVRGVAWLDHEWSETPMHPDAVGWDWTGMNLDDGSALTAFRLRRADGSALWAGGSFRPRGGHVRSFAADEVVFEPGRRWTSPATGASYPVEWTIHTPAGTFGVHARLDAQELDSRSSTGTVYWEGLSELRDAQGRAIGRGYLEMTGYAGRLRLG